VAGAVKQEAHVSAAEMIMEDICTDRARGKCKFTAGSNLIDSSTAQVWVVNMV
jgi:hypothetical protein